MPVEETENEVRVRVRMPSEFDEQSFRRIAMDEKQGIYAIIGCPKGHYKNGKCDTGTKVQSLRFSKDKGWTKDKAEQWARENGYTPKAANITLQKSFSYVFDISKVQAEERIVEGYASVEVPDRDNEIISREALKIAFQNYMKNPVLRWMHEREPIGKILDGYVDNKGLYVRAYISDATERSREVWGLIKDGIVRAFSIGGRVLEAVREYSKALGRKITKITKMELLEISVVDIPANPETLFQVVRKSVGELGGMEEELVELKAELNTRIDELEKKLEKIEEIRQALEKIGEKLSKVEEKQEEQVEKAAETEEKEEESLEEKIRKVVSEELEKLKPIRKGLAESPAEAEKPEERDFTLREVLLKQMGVDME